MKQVLDQIRALHPDPSQGTSHPPPSVPSTPNSQFTPLKALTEQLKRRTSPPSSLSPELADRVDVVLKELQSLNGKIESNLQLLKRFVTFLRTAQQVRVSSGVLPDVAFSSVTGFDQAHHCCSFLCCYTLIITGS